MTIDEQRKAIFDEFHATQELYMYDARVICQFCHQWHGDTERQFNSLAWMADHPPKPGAMNDRGLRIPFA